MNMKMKLAGLFLGALIATSSAFANGGSCGAGKCGAEMKKEMKGSCGAGKCGAEMKKDTKGSCGAGKCGSESSNEMKPKTNN